MLGSVPARDRKDMVCEQAPPACGMSQHVFRLKPSMKELRRVHHPLPQLRESRGDYRYLDIDTKKSREFELTFF